MVCGLVRVSFEGLHPDVNVFVRAGELPRPLEVTEAGQPRDRPLFQLQQVICFFPSLVLYPCTTRWGDEQKPFASMAVGPSPTLELALYTTCLLARVGSISLSPYLLIEL